MVKKLTLGHQNLILFVHNHHIKVKLNYYITDDVLVDMRLTTLTGNLKSKQSVRKPILYAQNERLFKNDQHKIYQSRI